MQIPKFLIGDNTEHPDAVFVIHTDYPRFIMNVITDEWLWLEDFDEAEEEELIIETQNLVQAALDFYDSEINRYET